MSPSKQLSFSINPLWPHYVALSALAFGLFAGLFRFFILDRVDPLHCGALLNHGSWLDYNFRNWQPEGCMLHSYKPNEASLCLASKQVVFIGDSVTRKLFFQFGQAIDTSLPNAPSDNEHKHSDHSLLSKAGTRLQFYWDPYLNSTRTHGLILSPSVVSSTTQPSVPALLVLGTGLWYLRYPSSGGLQAWEANIETTVNAIVHSHINAADEIVLLPVEEVVTSKLSPERASSMKSSDIDAMNSDLFHRIHLPHSRHSGLFSGPSPSLPISLPLVFNKMLGPSQTEDGLHFFDSVVKAQANILLNLRCNDVLPKTFPLDKTCCRRYPQPSLIQFIILVAAILWGPCTWYLSHRSGQNSPGGPLIKEDNMSALIFSAAVALIYTADRTGFWLKEQKQFNPWTFAFLSLSCLGFGLATVSRGDKDLGFLNREQTDEWKGWMQIAILIYHYLGASKISGIYNPIRVLVAAYLFMTGYGHTTFYIKKGDFGFLRVAQVMIRLNLFTLVLAYTMDTDYISYYFAPLVSMWFLIIYATMGIGSQFNERTHILVIKVLLSMAVMKYFMSEPWLLQSLFDFLDRVCRIKWSAREWAFRVNLDLWIVYFGMFVSIAVIKIREHRLTDHPYWPSVVNVSICVSGLVMVWFFGFELWQENKFVYNTWHPYISFLPIAAFVILRNANTILRSASSRAFAFIGTCSLETFIIQYHFWLAGDTKGVLLVIPGTRWRPANFVITSIMFVYLSHKVAQATGQITTRICSGAKKSLPTTNPNGLQSHVASTSRHITTAPNEHSKDSDGTFLPFSPARSSRRWVDRLADSSSPPPSSGLDSWRPGLKTKLAMGVGAMWFTNSMWSYH